MDSCPLNYHNDLCKHFTNSAQSGGALPFFAGGRQQSGAGIGSLFKGLARSLIPLASSFGRKIVKSTARSVKMQAAKSLQNIGSDLLQGRPIGESMKARGRETLQAVSRDVLRGSINKKPRRRKRKQSNPKHKLSTKKPRQSRNFTEAY